VSSTFLPAQQASEATAVETPFPSGNLAPPPRTATSPDLAPVTTARTALMAGDGGRRPAFGQAGPPALRGSGTGSWALARTARQPGALAANAGSRRQTPAAAPAARSVPAVPTAATPSAVTVVAREAAEPRLAEPAPVAAPPAGAGPAPGGPAHLTSGVAAAPGAIADLSPAELSKLAERVYEYLARRLRGELLDDRERRGLLGDPL
jgi:hypothetical protein